jgi:hypothetical protein
MWLGSLFDNFLGLFLLQILLFDIRPESLGLCLGRIFGRLRHRPSRRRGNRLGLDYSNY